MYNIYYVLWTYLIFASNLSDIIRYFYPMFVSARYIHAAPTGINFAAKDHRLRGIEAGSGEFRRPLATRGVPEE